MSIAIGEIHVAAPSLAIFRPYSQTACPACGEKPTRLYRLSRMLQGKCPRSPVTFRYCPGGRPPTETHDGAPGMPKALQRILEVEDREVVHHCAGVPEAHLHVECGCCGAKWLTKLYSPHVEQA